MPRSDTLRVGYDDNSGRVEWGLTLGICRLEGFIFEEFQDIWLQGFLKQDELCRRHSPWRLSFETQGSRVKEFAYSRWFAGTLDSGSTLTELLFNVALLGNQGEAS